MLVYSKFNFKGVIQVTFCSRTHHFCAISFWKFYVMGRAGIQFCSLCQNNPQVTSFPKIHHFNVVELVWVRLSTSIMWTGMTTFGRFWPVLHKYYSIASSVLHHCILIARSLLSTCCNITQRHTHIRKLVCMTCDLKNNTFDRCCSFEK